MGAALVVLASRDRGPALPSPPGDFEESGYDAIIVVVREGSAGQIECGLVLQSRFSGVWSRRYSVRWTARRVWLHCVTPFGCGWLPGSGRGEEPGVVVVPAGGGLVASASL